MRQRSCAYIRAYTRLYRIAEKTRRSVVNGNEYARSSIVDTIDLPFRVGIAVHCHEYLRGIRKRWRLQSVSWNADPTFFVLATCSKISSGGADERHYLQNRQPG